MKQYILAICLMSLIFAIGCADNRAEELYETAQFEELQNNREHAQKLYEEIRNRFPDGPYAEKAAQRLSELKEQEQD